MTPTPQRIAVLGGGIVGLSVALEALQRWPGATVALFEKEPQVAQHQTGRNSGVVHSGLYYRPGSLKARLCIAGKQLLEEFCGRRGLPLEVCGKVVVATAAAELPRLAALAERASASGVPHARLDGAGLRRIEPHAAGLEALHVPVSAIVDYTAVCEALRGEIDGCGRGRVHLGARVRHVENDGTRATVHLGDRAEGPFDSVVNCCGLHSDRVARGSGVRTATRIVPFRGEYFELTEDATHLVRGLIYPVPDPRFPFLGVHFTRMVGGGVECGPNAVFALAREGYRWRDVSPRDLLEALAWPGTLRLFARHWRTGLGETWRSVSKGAFVKALQRLVPEIRAEHLVRAPAGVRAQALTRDGQLLDDFAIETEGPAVHVLNAPSPAATASFAIAREVVDRVVAQR